MAAFVGVATPELEFTEQITCHSIDPIELTLIPAIGARIRILHEPVRLTVAAQRLLAGLALDGALQDVVADAADELGQEGLYVLRVVNPVLLIYVLLLLP